MVPLQNFIEESRFFYVTTSIPTRLLYGIPINTDPVTVDYRTSPKPTPKTTTRGQNIVVLPVITPTTNIVSSATQLTNQTTGYQTEVTTAQSTACPTAAAVMSTTTIPTT